MPSYKIPSEVRAELSRLVASASETRTGEGALERLVEVISVLPPKAIHEVEDLVGRLTHALAAVDPRATWMIRRASVWSQRITPDHAPVFMLNKSGYVREAALSAVTQLPNTA